MTSLTFYEFFAGGGLARIGLGPQWTCLFANDIDEKKAETYRRNFSGAPELVVEDIHRVTTDMLPGRALLAWASFPCQDLSLAGKGGGLRAGRSGTFWPFWDLIIALDLEGRAAPIIAIENVVGLLTSNKGRDFQELVAVITAQGYRLGAMVIDAVHFVPQSRPRLFIVAVKDDAMIPDALITPTPHAAWHPVSVVRAYRHLAPSMRDSWVWWNLPSPERAPFHLRDVIDPAPTGVAWHSPEETQRLLSLMSPVNLAKVRHAQLTGRLHIGTIYKRTRIQDGVKRQRAEVRFDGVSGCLRTPAGGSSRQTILVVEGDVVRSRLLSVREAARLMGLPDSYWLPERYNDGYHVMGDAVVVPVVSWLEQHILRPLATSIVQTREVPVHVSASTGYSL
ncbi:MAG: DNA cytosine methyltransferase [Roseiflexaceae bacterium]|nr:DNA cytosine methyltransferase [Roseiflexaceae bacterium]